MYLKSRNKHKTVAVAESCTGGLLGATLTELPGASKFFVGGVIAYSNEVKIKLLKVPRGIITSYGAVSEQVAATMAIGVRVLFKTDIGIGITGIAGPGGGSKRKPVGTVYIAISTEGYESCNKLLLKGDRKAIRRAAVRFVINRVFRGGP